MKKKTVAGVLLAAALLGGCGGEQTAGVSENPTEQSNTEESVSEESVDGQVGSDGTQTEDVESASEETTEEVTEADVENTSEAEGEIDIDIVEEGILAEIAAACAENDVDGAWTLMESDAYAEAYTALAESEEEQIIVQTPSGRIGMYHADGQALAPIGDYFIYYGGYEGLIREGDGLWLEVDDGYRYSATGTWERDLPNGTITESQSSSTAEVTDGLYDGERTWSTPDGDQFTEYYTNGKYVTYGEMIYVDYDGTERDGYKTTEDGRLFVPTEEVDDLHGILGFY